MKKKDILPNLITLIIAVLISSLVSVAATGNLFDSNEVTYDNTSSGMNSTDVKGALDELYAAASDYSGINTRVSNIENIVKDTSSSTIRNDGIQVGVRSSSYGWTDWYYGGQIAGNAAPSNNETFLIGAWKNGVQGTGKLKLYADTIELTANSIVDKNNRTIKGITCLNNSYSNIAITTKSASGAYYSNPITIPNLPSGVTIISNVITWWGNATASFVPVISDGTKLAFFSDISMTVGSVSVRTCYI